MLSLRDAYMTSGATALVGNNPRATTILCLQDLWSSILDCAFWAQNSVTDVQHFVLSQIHLAP